jgi:HSP20 family protein
MLTRPSASADLWDFRDELSRLFSAIDEHAAANPLHADCVPSLDVFETDTTLEIAVDLPGVAASSVRVLVKSSAVLIAGEKAARRGRRDASFHLVERGFGRFARAVRLASPCDVERATAILTAGELRVSVPKRTERRGRAYVIDVQTVSTASGPQQV